MELQRRPPHLRKRIGSFQSIHRVREILRQHRLHTVCESALCPNLGECFARSVATFLILGDVCTRNCRFCNIKQGVPTPLNPEEPELVARAAKELGLKHVVVTSVTRDDLPDGGASHFAMTINALKRELNGSAVEVLTPDFCGNEESLERVAGAAPDIFNHNLECIQRLYPEIRPRAEYERSLAVLGFMKKGWPEMLTKSGIMVGLGERIEEVVEVMDDLRRVQCDMITIGQYLSPSKEHAPVREYVPPERFEEFKTLALERGFVMVASEPYVRSSYHAEEFFSQVAGLSNGPG